MTIPIATLMNRHGTDKLYRHHYDGEYARHFEPWEDRQFNLLEIGIGGYNTPGRGGESLKVWRDFFRWADITGIDIEDKSFLDGGRIKTLVADQSKPESLTAVNDARGPFSIVIDDGSHVQDHILTSFFTLFPLLAPGGIYVIEDMETAYRADHGGDPDKPPTIGLIQRLVDGLHWRFWKGRGPTAYDKMVKSIHVSYELAFIYKQG